MSDAATAKQRGKRLAALAESLRGRRTVSLFEPGEVPRELLLEAIRVARWAPNHKLTEPWRFYLLGPGTVGELINFMSGLIAAAGGEEAGKQRRARLEAVPGWFVVTASLGGDDLQQREDYAATCCAIQNCMLYLWEAGVGVKWTTGAPTRTPEFYELLGIDPDLETVVGLFWYGYPRIVPKQKRQPVARIVSELP